MRSSRRAVLLFSWAWASASVSVALAGCSGTDSGSIRFGDDGTSAGLEQPVVDRRRTARVDDVAHVAVRAGPR